jgi:hypothetical protein
MHRTAALIVILASSCAHETAAASQPARLPIQQPAVSAASDSVLAQLEALILSFGHSRQRIQAKLGPARGLSIVTAENAEGQIDTLITLQYPGLEIMLRKPANDSEEYFSNVRALDTAFALPHQLELFQTPEASVRQLLGAPNDTQSFGDTIVAGYETPDGLVIQFYYLASRLVRIRWVYEQG